MLPVVVLCVLFAFRAAAELAVPALTGRVVDQAHLLDGDAARVANAIRDLEQATGGQMAILTVPTLKDDALESFSLRVAEAWKIGRKGQDNGALLVIVRDSHGIRLEIGYGWEGTVNDARAGDIIRGMGPFFRGGRFGDGCIYAVRSMESFVTGKPPAGMPRAARSQGDGGDNRIFIIVWVVFFILIVVSSFFNRGRTYGGRGSGGFYGGGFSSGGGGFSGGGGSFGGGGASGSW